MSTNKGGRVPPCSCNLYMRYFHVLLITILLVFAYATISFAVDRNKFPDVWERLNYGWYNPDTGKLNGDLAYEAPQEYFDKCKAALIHGISLYNHKRLAFKKFNTQWVKVLGECKELYAKNGTVLGPKAYAKVQEWKNRPHDMALLQDVNEYWNHSIVFRRDDPDPENPFADVWSGPYELEKRGGGDCEDYSIAKYYMLKELGFDAHDMRIVTGHKKETKGHALLGIWLDGEIWILDNTKDTIIPHMQEEYTVGVKSMNEYGQWAHLPLHQ